MLLVSAHLMTLEYCVKILARHAAIGGITESDINLALASAELKTRLNSEGAIATPTTPESNRYSSTYFASDQFHPQSTRLRHLRQQRD